MWKNTYLPVYPPSPETPSPPQEDEHEGNYTNTPTPPIENAPPGYWPEDDIFTGWTSPDEDTHQTQQRSLTEAEHLANIDFSLQVIVVSIVLILSIAFIWFLILKPITWFVDFY